MFYTKQTLTNPHIVQVGWAKVILLVGLRLSLTGLLIEIEGETWIVVHDSIVSNSDT